jgi:2-keto-3-deoxy-L-rhamnonate aldolase
MSDQNITVFGDGIYTPVPTFFKENYDLDLETQVKQAKKLYESAINGLVIAGSMGESIHLTRQERLKLLSTIREAIPDKKFKLISGLPYTNISDTVEEISLIKENGGDFAILLSPGYYGNSLTHQEGIISYFEAVADKSVLPIIIYHYPGVSNGTEIVAETFQVLAKHQNIVGVKLTHFSLDKYILLTGTKEQNLANNFKPFTGLGQILIPSLAVGAFGAIDGLSGIFPKTLLRLYNLIKEDKSDEALELQYLITRANRLIFDLNLVGVKHALNKIYGLGSSEFTGRPPLNNHIDDATYSKYEGDLKKLEEIESTL